MSRGVTRQLGEGVDSSGGGQQQRGESDHDQNTHFVCRFIESATISEPFKTR